MAYTHNLATEANGFGSAIQETQAFTADLRVGQSTSIDNAVSEQLVTMAVDVSEIKLVKLLSDQDLTLEFNVAGAGVPTINLLAGNPYIWYTGSYFTDLLTVDITALYLSNSSGSTAIFKMTFLFDSTP